MLALEVPDDASRASDRIKDFVKRINRLQTIKENMMKNISISSIETLLDTIDASSSANVSFDSVQSSITSATFVEAMTGFLKLLPKDPNGLLSSGTPEVDKGLTVPVRLVSSCVLISHFPDAVLVPSSPVAGGAQADAGDESIDRLGDESSEASQTFLSARFLLKALHRFLKYLKILLGGGSNENNAKIARLSTFKQILLNYRFVCRTFITSLDRWKKMDNLRLVSSLEVSYCQCYAIILQCRRSASADERAAAEETADGAEQQQAKITTLLRQLLKENAASRLEELQAQVEAHLSENGRNRAVSDLQSLSVTAETSARIAEGVSAENAKRGAAQSSEAATKWSQEAEAALKRLSEMIGVENEKIAYEIMYDPKYRLEDAPAPESVMLPLTADARAFHSCPADAPVAARMKRNLLFVLRERLIWSMQPSPIANLSALRSGLVVPVKLSSDTYLSCKIVGVARDSDGGDVLTVDVVYLVDGTAETITDLDRFRLSAEGVDPLPLLLAVEDLRCRLLALAPKGAAGAERLSFDLALLRELLLLPHSAANCKEATGLVMDLLAGMFGFLRDLQSPARGDEMLLWWETYHRVLHAAATATDVSAISDAFASLIPSFFEYMSASIDQLNRDLANYYISTVVPVLSRHGPAFMLRRFVTRLMLLPPVNTINMLNGVLQSQNDKFATFKAEVNEAFGQPILGDAEFCASAALAEIAAPGRVSVLQKAAVARMFVNILQKPFRLSTRENLHLLPETLHIFETDKLAILRDFVDVISLELSIVIATRQILATPCAAAGLKGGSLLSEPEEASLTRRLDVLLGESDIDVRMLATEVTATVARCSAHADGGSSALAEEVLKTMRTVVSDKNPVLMIFAKRLYKVIFRAMLDLPYTGSLSTYSLHSPCQAASIGRVCLLAQKIFAVHFSIYRSLYSDLLSTKAFLESLDQ